MIAENTKIRIDSGYFSKEAIAAESLVESLPHHPFSDITSVFRKGIFDIKADTYVAANEGIPFVRIGDLKGGLIQKDSTAWISDDAHRLEAKTALKRGDLVISKTAYPAASMVNLKECNVSQDTIAVRLNPFGRAQFKSGFIAAFLNTKQGYSLMARRFQGNVQQHLSLEDGKAIRIPLFGLPLQNRVHAIVQAADRQQNASSKKHKEAEDTLFDALGLADWTPPEPLSYSARASNALAAGRLDAQYFRPLFVQVEQLLDNTGRAARLGAVLSTNVRGRQPNYANKGLPVINSKHVRTNRVVLSDNRTAIEMGSPVIVEEGDVLVNGTGVGTIGRSAPFLHDQRALPDNHVTVLRSAHVDPVYLAVFLNSPLGQWQIERHIKGSSGQIELYPRDIAKIVFWDAPADIQTTVRDAVLSAFTKERRAQELLEFAKHAVEIAIEDGEAAAMTFLGQAEATN